MAGTPLSTRSVEIRVTRGEAFRLDATVESDAPTSGTYELHVLKSGRTGRSDSRQSGAFNVLGTGRRVISSQSVALSEGDHIRAELTVTWADGQTERDMFEETVEPSQEG